MLDTLRRKRLREGEGGREGRREGGWEGGRGRSVIEWWRCMEDMIVDMTGLRQRV